MRLITTGTLAVCVGLFSANAFALPSGFSKTRVASGLTRPTAMAFAPDGRLFITERGTESGGTGTVRVVKNGAPVATPVISIPTDNSGVKTNERGVIGLAIDPDFASNGFIYVYYTVRGSTAHNRVSRFTVVGDRADPSTELKLLDLNDLKDGNHNGGGLLFGNDGKLYIGVGENHVASNAAKLDTHLGKILRINKDGSVPGDNPFADGGGTSARDRIWAFGMRNPYTLAVNPESGRIFVNDVGENTWEEINDLVKGRNYGWTGGSSDGDSTSFFRYNHNTGKCIAGGAFYVPANAPGNFSKFQGQYFFGDYTAGFIRAINVSDRSVTSFETGLNGPIDIDVAANGELFFLLHKGGELWRVTSSSANKQQLVVSTESIEIPEGGSDTFTVQLATAANLTVNVAKTSGDKSITVPATALKFTTGNFNIPQTVTVSAAQDPDLNTESAIITVSASGVTSKPVAVAAIDDDVMLAVAITAPHEGEVIAGATEDFYGGTDGQGIKGDFFIDGKLEFTDVGEGHYHFGGGHGNFDTTVLKDGKHTLKLVVTDADGNTGSHQINVTVNNRPAAIDGDPGDADPSPFAGCGGGNGSAAGCLLLVGLAYRTRRKRS
jgi:glucose/arabinose dehydrogenase